MKSTLFTAMLLSAGLSFAAFAADTETTPVQNVRSDDFATGKQAIEAKDWKKAADSFGKVVAKDTKNADAYNFLGFSQRWLGNYNEAFAAYGKALALDPNHKGALNYSGIAYLKTNQKAKADENLLKLQKICAQCEETTKLAQAIADYKPAQ